MDQGLDNKISTIDKLILLVKKNKFIYILLLSLILSITIFIIFFKIYIEKKNDIISERYVQAGIYLIKNEEKKSREILEEIILSKNRFYSILALNTILEKNLEEDKTKILNYFDKVESITKSKDAIDLLNLKKGLYLIKNNNEQKGKELLKSLIESNSNIKSIAEEILDN